MATWSNDAITIPISVAVTVLSNSQAYMWMRFLFWAKYHSINDGGMKVMRFCNKDWKSQSYKSRFGYRNKTDFRSQKENWEGDGITTTFLTIKFNHSEATMDIMSLIWPFLMTCVDEFLPIDTEGAYTILIWVLEGFFAIIPFIEPVNH